MEIAPEELGFTVTIGELLMTECEMVNGFVDPQDEPPHFTRGYGLTFGMSERKAMAVALVDRALRAPEYGEEVAGPAGMKSLCWPMPITSRPPVSFRTLNFPTMSISRPNWRCLNACNGRINVANALTGYNFAYLDEQTKRMIRRAILKAVAIPGYQCPSAVARCRCPTAGEPAVSSLPPASSGKMTS